MALLRMSRAELGALRVDAAERYCRLRDAGLNLQLTRGRPSPEQLDLSNGLLTVLGAQEYVSRGVDCRNYGGAEGLTELRDIFSELLHVPTPQLLAGGNSSLTMMYLTINFAMLFGVDRDSPAWSGGPVRFLCPVPGYDRHFAICEELGIELVTVSLGEDGPDLDEVKALVVADPGLKGMWVVPAYSNPTGSVYSESKVRELVAMRTAAPDFRIFWDNAYAVHHLTDDPAPVIDVLGLAHGAGNPDRVYVFASTSKMTFGGAGVGFWGSSPANVRWFLEHMAAESIGPDKVNQLRQARFFRDADGVRAHMRAHRALLAPKFALVDRILSDRLGDLDFARWTTPRGGYFISVDVLPGTAGAVTELALDAGIELLPAGSTFPYRHDPADANLRIAPSFPSEDELAVAVDGLCTCAILAAADRLLA